MLKPGQIARLPNKTCPADWMGPVHASFRCWSANHSKKESSIKSTQSKKGGTYLGLFFNFSPWIWETPHWQHIAEHCEFMPRAIAPSILQMQHGHPSSTNSRISAPWSTRVLSLAPFPYCVGFVCLTCSGASKATWATQPKVGKT